jgi:hypothetical protein
MADPTLSLCIATANRAPFVDDCLSRLAPLQAIGFPLEVVVSDDASTDETAEVLAHWQGEHPFLRVYRASEAGGPAANLTNALRQARGEFVVFLGDGDRVVLQALATHVARLAQETDLAAIYTDWSTWDVDEDREIGRVFGLTEAVSFPVETPLELANFVLARGLWPDVAVYRRAALAAAWHFTGRSAQTLPLMYAVSRLGRVRFDPLPFYRETRVPKRGLSRGRAVATPLQPESGGEAMRLGLETLLASALRDSGMNGVPANQTQTARNAIDGVLHTYASLEIDRALKRGDFLQALELRRRLVLWRGAGSPDDIQHDVETLVLPAAATSVALTYESLSQARGISLRGFQHTWMAQFFAFWRPDIPILLDDALSGDEVLIVHRDFGSQAADPDPDAANAIVFQQVVSLYRIAREVIDLNGF